MKKLIIALILVFSSCLEKPETIIKHLNGYWEIEKVTLADGTIKEYNINETIDYIYINDSLNGFRRKVKPTFSGDYKTSRDSERFKAKVEADSFNLYYSTKFASWKETVLKATSKKLKVVNQNNDVYLYKRYVPITLD